MEIKDKILLSLVFSVISLAGYSQTEKTDTLLRVSEPSKLVITESEEGMRVYVQGKDDKKEYKASTFTPYSLNSSVKTSNESYPRNMTNLINYGDGMLEKAKSGKPYWTTGVQGVCLGLTKSVNQEPAGGLQWSKSFEICWMSCFNVGYHFNKRSSVLLGLGFDWRNYKVTTSERCLVANDVKGIEWSEYPEGMRGKNSRLKVFSLQLPLLYGLLIPGTSSMVLKVGPVFNFNTYASLKTRYYDAAGNEQEDFTTDISPRRFTVDFFGSISYRYYIGLYVRYSPMKVMDAVSTLNFQPLTVGVAIGI